MSDKRMELSCEKCWSDALTRHRIDGGSRVGHYFALVSERAYCPCTPREQAGQYWSEELQADIRVTMNKIYPGKIRRNIRALRSGFIVCHGDHWLRCKQVGNRGLNFSFQAISSHTYWDWPPSLRFVINAIKEGSI